MITAVPYGTHRKQERNKTRHQSRIVQPCLRTETVESLTYRSIVKRTIIPRETEESIFNSSTASLRSTTSKNQDDAFITCTSTLYEKKGNSECVRVKNAVKNTPFCFLDVVERRGTGRIKGHLLASPGN